MGVTISRLIASAGVGDPWDLADQVISSDGGTVVAAASAYDEAAGHAAESMAAAAKADPMTAMSYVVDGHPVHDGDAAISRTRVALGDGGEHLAVIGRVLRTVAGDLGTAKTGAAAEISALEASLRALDGAGLAEPQLLEAAASAIRVHGRRIRELVDAYEQSVAAGVNALLGMGMVASALAGAAPPGGDPARTRQAALFHSLTGHDPLTEQDWRVAATLDPLSANPTGGEPPASVVVTRITPVPGGGLVYGSAFIAAPQVQGFLPWEKDSGDSRTFDPTAPPDASRVSYVVDYENGLVVARQNPSHSTSGEAAVGVPKVGVEQDPQGRVRLRIEAANPLAPELLTEAGWSVRGDVVVDPHGGPHGVPSINGAVGQYPSWEAYSSRPGQPPTTVLEREQNMGTDALGPAVNLPFPSAPVGQHPEAVDDWRRHYHPDQVVVAAVKQELRVIDPLLDPRLDPFFDYPLDPIPPATPDGAGGLTVPEARHVG